MTQQRVPTLPDPAASKHGPTSRSDGRYARTNSLEPKRCEAAAMLDPMLEGKVLGITWSPTERAWSRLVIEEGAEGLAEPAAGEGGLVAHDWA